MQVHCTDARPLQPLPEKFLEVVLRDRVMGRKTGRSDLRNIHVRIADIAMRRRSVWRLPSQSEAHSMSPRVTVIAPIELAWSDSAQGD